MSIPTAKAKAIICKFVFDSFLSVTLSAYEWFTFKNQAFTSLYIFQIENCYLF